MLRFRRAAGAIAGIVLASGHLSAKPPLMSPADAPILGEMDPYLIDRFLIDDSLGKDAGIKDLVEDSEFEALVTKHGLQLFGGPALGDMSDRGGSVWLRTAKPAEVAMLIDGKVVACGRTQLEGDLATVLRFEGLEPATEYAYDIEIAGERVFADPDKMPRLRTHPSPGQKARFEVAFGGCARFNYPKERVWPTVTAREPAAFIWLGDNLYIDDPESRTRQRVYYYRRQLLPSYRAMTAAVPQYAIWDDHDFGANDVSGFAPVDRPAWKVPVWEVFRENWANPAYGGGDSQPGCWFSFRIGDVDFFMTDGRYYRDFKGGKTMLGPVQKKWLLDALAASTATFKVIASGTLWTEHADKGGKDSWWGVKEEREEVFSLIDEKEIGGVVLISADRHRADVYQIERPNGYTLYELENGKLTNDHTHATRPKAIYSHNAGNFFGSLDFDFTKTDPELTYRCITIDGKEIYSLVLKRSMLQR